ncbi:MAG: lysophospholipid acyltransferase family protein [Candidatus Melainabacteria bacterium]|nr:lysophospholipid acyltransferase family protein [Candidatus Melainabacteria bacterium]
MQVRNLLAKFIRLYFGLDVVSDKDLQTKNEPVVFFANHSSHIDFVLIWASLPPDIRANLVPIAASDYWCKNAIRRWICAQFFHGVMIERNEVSRKNNPVREIARVLEQGHCVLIFPEGGRKSHTVVQDFKSGIYHISKRMPNVEFIPVQIVNANRSMPAGTVIPLPLVCTLNFHEPIKLEEKETRQQFLTRARMAIDEERVA